ncbi:hypothetical protein L2E82_22274 [Cichorium intybus]|uniref:Uncharacterized protein n=1 Tax=Cichorium intybus TaxID=13427 RepID=A0ACB9DYB8_CICIN|nr:hypothetical protein L2E82_22274 [Cichorium intybus]
MGIQETQLTDWGKIDVQGCWGTLDYDYVGVNSDGKSGGLVSIWNKTCFQKSEVVKSKNYIIIKGKWTGTNNDIIFANIYGPHELAEQRRLWQDLLEVKNSLPGSWVMFGDFNVVRRSEERFNSLFCPESASAFNRFIFEADLHDFNMGGEKFTFMSRVGAKLSKLDRFLACSNFLATFPSLVVTAHPRYLSDHCPVTLTSCQSDYGPPPFKLFNSWILKDGFDYTVKEAWENFVGFGTPDAYLANKLKNLKMKIKQWRARNEKEENLEILTIKNTVSNLEKLAEKRALNESELKTRSHGLQRILEVEKITVLDLKQKSRVKWAVEGDENTKFFHGYINCKYRKNTINGLMVNGTWVSSVNEIKGEVLRYFKNKFSESWPSRPKLVSPYFKSISMMDAIKLEAPFTLDEVKVAVWACGSDKAPGPDGFTFKFIKTYWDTLKSDVMNCVLHFDKYGTLARGCNSSFITLAPKVKDPTSLSDFRPICLIGCVYKIISKILAIRLKKIIGTVISDVQSAYVEGRNILDGPLVINELYSWAKKTRRKILLFKVDFEKAFDSVNWEFLDSILSQMGFGTKWRSWISGCLNSSRASVIINGSPTDEFEISKGVRQGDPLSPFLFIIAMEGLNVALQEARDKGLFKGVQLPNDGPCISHLFYADDALFVGEWDRVNLKNLARILKCFQVSSGLKVNFHKSRVFGIGAPESETSNWASILGCDVGSFPFTYLGVPVGANMNLTKNWKPIIEKFQNKLSTWKSKALSFGGRLTLITSVLGNLPTYFFSLFMAPVAVTDKLESIRRRFLWGGDEDKKKIHWVAWDKVLASKSAGGLGVGSIRALNVAMIVKWWWRLKTEKDSLWGKVIVGLHNLKNKPHSYLSNRNISGVWNNIASVKKDLRRMGLEMGDIFNLQVKSGENTLFWYDKWIGSEKLQTKYPSLYNIEQRKGCTVADRFYEGSFVGHWASCPIESDLARELGRLQRDLDSVHLLHEPDNWKCPLDPDGKYSVCALRRYIDQKTEVNLSLPSITWCNEVPIKVNCFVWRASQNKIPSLVALRKRGVETDSTCCGACINGMECTDHILGKRSDERMVGVEFLTILFYLNILNFLYPSSPSEIGAQRSFTPTSIHRQQHTPTGSAPTTVKLPLLLLDLLLDLLQLHSCSICCFLEILLLDLLLLLLLLDLLLLLFGFSLDRSVAAAF